MINKRCGWDETGAGGWIVGLALVGPFRFFGYFFLKKVTQYEKKNAIKKFVSCIQMIASPKDITPLITFRVLFGGLMMVGALRFMTNGWIEKLYGEPSFFFKFYGVEWVTVPSEIGIYWLYGAIALSAGCIMIGFLYRIMTVVFFLTFTYAELLDATNYLNHYYLACILGLYLIFLPAHRAYSIDAHLWPKIRRATVPAWTIQVLILQLTLVYTWAGLNKLNGDWLFHAMPLAVWLPEHTDIPILGYFFQFPETAYLFSWIGAFYDLTVAYLLMYKKTRMWAYAAVVVFHLLTNLLFNIGLFPWIMIFSTLIFFPGEAHRKVWAKLLGAGAQVQKSSPTPSLKKGSQGFPVVLAGFLLFQLLFPLRHVLYPGNVLWTEEGYRFAWRVMLVEKVGQATFYVQDPDTGRKSEVINSHYLTTFQEKQMAIQPDFILQYAHFLADFYQRKHHIHNPIVTADVFVALNGRTSRRLIDPSVNLAVIKDGLWPKDFLIKYD